MVFVADAVDIQAVVVGFQSLIGVYGFCGFVELGQEAKWLSGFNP